MKLATLYITMSLIGVVLFISSCATQKVNLVDEGIITVEPKRSKKVIIDRVKVYQDNENAVISITFNFLSKTSSNVTSLMKVAFGFFAGSSE